MARRVRTSVRDQIPTILQTADAEIAAVIRTTTMAVNTRAKFAMTEPKTGRMYGRHQASAPGEAPAVDNGLLVNSLQEHYEDATGYAFTAAEYAVHLEYGAPRGHIAPRPFYTPAAEAERADFVRAMQRVY